MRSSHANAEVVISEINSQPDGLGDHGSHIPDDNLGNIVNEEENQFTENQD